jgi:hypothetical protein
MRRTLIIGFLIACASCGRGATPSDQYLFLWAGDADRKASDFLAVIDASPASANYGSIVASIPTGAIGSHPHHTEQEMPANGHLLANGFHAGQTWLFDLSKPLTPRIITSFGDAAGYSHPHTFVRLSNGNVLATYQYKAASSSPMSHDSSMAMATASENATGGLVEMDETGRVVRSASASDTTISYRGIFPYSALPLPAIDRAVSTTTDMDEKNVKATSEWIQLWRFSDLKLLQSIALEPGPRGDENRFTGEPRLLPDGKSVYIHTFNCGLYLLRGIDTPKPTVSFVQSFQGKDCGVPILAGHYWLQPVPELHGLVSLDIADPEHPREVSKLTIGDEKPHWLAIDPTGRRLVVNSSGGGTGNRLFIVNLDPGTGQLSIDDKFRDAGSSRAGVTLSSRSWPHGFVGTAAPHGTVFSRSWTAKSNRTTE